MPSKTSLVDEPAEPTGSHAEFELAAGPHVPVLDRASVQFLAWLFNTTQSRIYSWALALFVTNLKQNPGELDERLDQYFGTLVVDSVKSHLRDQERIGRALRRGRSNGLLKSVE